MMKEGTGKGKKGKICGNWRHREKVICPYTKTKW